MSTLYDGFETIDQDDYEMAREKEEREKLEQLRKQKEMAEEEAKVWWEEALKTAAPDATPEQAENYNLMMNEAVRKEEAAVKARFAYEAQSKILEQLKKKHEEARRERDSKKDDEIRRFNEVEENALEASKKEHADAYEYPTLDAIDEEIKKQEEEELNEENALEASKKEHADAYEYPTLDAIDEEIKKQEEEELNSQYPKLDEITHDDDIQSSNGIDDVKKVKDAEAKESAKKVSEEAKERAEKFKEEAKKIAEMVKSDYPTLDDVKKVKEETAKKREEQLKEEARKRQEELDSQYPALDEITHDDDDIQRSNAISDDALEDAPEQMSKEQEKTQNNAENEIPTLQEITDPDRFLSKDEREEKYHEINLIMDSVLNEQFDKIKSLHMEHDANTGKFSGLSQNIKAFEESKDKHGSAEFKEMYDALSKLEPGKSIDEMYYDVFGPKHDYSKIQKLREQIAEAYEKTQNYVAMKDSTKTKWSLGKGKTYLKEAQDALQKLGDMQDCIDTIFKNRERLQEHADYKYSISDREGISLKDLEREEVSTRERRKEDTARKTKERQKGKKKTDKHKTDKKKEQSPVSKSPMKKK